MNLKNRQEADSEDTVSVRRNFLTNNPFALVLHTTQSTSLKLSTNFWNSAS